MRQCALGYRGVKPRVSGRRSDTAILEAVRKAIPDSVEMMADANEKCTALEARRLLACAADCGALFVEEPLPADDLAGFRQLAAAYPRMIATGEHLQGMAEALPFIEEGLLGMVQPDLAAMGGLTECLPAAADRYRALIERQMAEHEATMRTGRELYRAWLERWRSQGLQQALVAFRTVNETTPSSATPTQRASIA